MVDIIHSKARGEKGNNSNAGNTSQESEKPTFQKLGDGMLDHINASSHLHTILKCSKDHNEDTFENKFEAWCKFQRNCNDFS